MRSHFKIFAASAIMALGLMQPAVAQTGSPPELQQLLQRYSDAWISRDAARIAALHSEDSVFHLQVEGSEPAKGREAIRKQFQKILTDNPGYRSTLRSAEFGPKFVVIEYDIEMNPPSEFTLGSMSYVPNGRPYSVPAIDIIHFDGGLVSAKITYLDTGVARANSKSTRPLMPGK